MGTIRKFFAIVSAATFMLGCSSSSELASAADPIADTEKQSSNYPTLKITARMTDEGVECPALRGTITHSILFLICQAK